MSDRTSHRRRARRQRTLEVRAGGFVTGHAIESQRPLNPLLTDVDCPVCHHALTGYTDWIQCTDAHRAARREAGAR